MINSPAPSSGNAETDREAIEAIVRSGPRGAIVLAGAATLVVVAIWFAFYLLVFAPRAATL